jgi:hypothetical protein
VNLLHDMLGHPAPSLDHPMWAEVHVVNGMERARVSLDGRVLWDGIVARDRVARLDELQAMEIVDIERWPVSSPASS